jgi:GTP-binding protein
LEKQREAGKPASVRVAIVGQPNVGKSSLVNKILKQDRTIVSDIPGTTHDPVDIHLEWKGTKITLTDTAGITRQATHEKGLERASILWALKAIETSHVTVLLIDPVKGVNSQDMKIAGHISDSFKSGEKKKKMQQNKQTK